MAGWNSILGRASNHSSDEAQRKMVDEANRIMQETRRIKSQDNSWYQKNGYATGGIVHPAQMAADDISTDNWRLYALAMRLRVREGHKLPFQHLSTALAGDKVFVFVVVKDQAVTLEDDHLLFPSDTLITQLRLLQE